MVMRSWLRRLLGTDYLADVNVFQKEIESWPIDRIATEAGKVLTDSSKYRSKMAPRGEWDFAGMLPPLADRLFRQFEEISDIGGQFVLRRPNEVDLMAEIIVVGSDLGGQFRFGISPPGEEVMLLDGAGSRCESSDAKAGRYPTILHLILVQSRL